MVTMRTATSPVMPMLRLLVTIAALVAASTLAGCTEPSPQPVQDDEPDVCTVSSPDDTSCLQAAAQGSNASHRHDYWHGKERLVVLDYTGPVGTVGVSSESRQTVRATSPIPQGTEAVEVAATWTEHIPSHYGKLELYVATAADREPWLVGDLVAGETLTIASDNNRNDLPHQQISQWRFVLVFSSDVSPGPIVVQWEMTLTAEAIRGLDIPLMDGHPDLWQGLDAMPLMHVVTEQHVTARGETIGPAGASYACARGCLDIMAPDDGALVPFDAAAVVVTLERSDLPFVVGLSYHGADELAFKRLEPTSESGTTRTYIIPVEGAGDGPYSRQSQWEFRAFIDDPTKDRIYAGQYAVTAEVHRTLPA